MTEPTTKHDGPVATVLRAAALLAGGGLGLLAASCASRSGTDASPCAGKDEWACFVSGLEAIDDGRMEQGGATLEAACDEGEERACGSATALRAALGTTAPFSTPHALRLEGADSGLDAVGQPQGPTGRAASALSSALPSAPSSATPAARGLFPSLFAGLDAKRAACAWGMRPEGVVVCLVASGAELTTHLRALDRSLRRNSRVSLAIPAGPGLRMGGFTLFLPAAAPGSARLAMAGAPLPSGSAVADAVVWRGVERPREPLALVWVTPRGLLSGSFAHELAHVAYGRDPVTRRCVEEFWRDGLAPSERARVGMMVEGAYGGLSAEALREELHAYLLQDKPEMQPLAGRLQGELRRRYVAFLSQPGCRGVLERYEALRVSSGPLARTPGGR